MALTCHRLHLVFFYQAMVSVKSAEISSENLVIRFSESVDGFPLPKGHSQNPELEAPQKPGAEAFLKDK
jgi:hypothetical protein